MVATVDWVGVGSGIKYFLMKDAHMHTTSLCEIAGSIMLPVPSVLLDMLNMQIGTQVELGVENGRLVVIPASSKPRYSLDELLAQCDLSAPYSEDEREWLDAPAVGCESI